MSDNDRGINTPKLLDLTEQNILLCMTFTSRLTTLAQRGLNQLIDQLSILRNVLIKYEQLGDSASSTQSPLLFMVQNVCHRLERLQEDLQRTMEQLQRREFPIKRHSFWVLGDEHIKNTTMYFTQSAHSMASIMSHIQSQVSVNLQRAEILAELSFSLHQTDPDVSPAQFNSVHHALFTQVMQWASGAGGKAICWLHGPLGSGKSTVAHSLAISQQVRSTICARVFFDANSQKRCTPFDFIQAIAKQLANAEKIQKHSANGEVGGRDFESLQSSESESLETILVQVLGDPTKACPIVVIVDSLEHLEEDKDVICLLSVFKSLVTRYPMRVFMTSRSDLPLRLGLIGSGVQADLAFYSTSKVDLKENISALLKEKMGVIKEHHISEKNVSGWPVDWPGPSDIKVLADAAGHSFQFTTVVCTYMSRNAKIHPHTRLLGLVELADTNDYFDANCIYASLVVLGLNNLSPHDKDHDPMQFQHTIGLAAAILDPLPASDLAVFLQIPSDQLINMAEQLHPFARFLFSPESGGQLRIEVSLAKSLRDLSQFYEVWLGVSQGEIHYKLIETCYALIDRHFGRHKWVPHSHNTQRHVIDVSEDCFRDDFHVPPSVKYACVHWAHHFHWANPPPIPEISRLGSFLGQHLLHLVQGSTIECVMSSLKTLEIKIADPYDFALAQFTSDALRMLESWRLSKMKPQTCLSRPILLCQRNAIRYMFESKFPNQIQSVAGGQNDDLCIRTIVTGQPSIVCFGFSPDSNTILTLSDHGVLSSYNADANDNINQGQTSRLSPHRDYIQSAAFSQNGELIAVGPGQGILDVYHVPSKCVVQPLETPSRWISTLAISNDSALTVCGLVDGTIEIWDIETGELLNTLGDHNGLVSSVAFSRNSRLLVSGSVDSTVRVWRLKTSQCVDTFHNHGSWISAVAFSKDSTFIASGSGEGSVIIRWTDTGQLVRRLNGHYDWVSSVIFIPNSPLLASASGDRTIRIWRVTTGECTSVLNGHVDTITSLAILKDSHSIASASDDGTVRLWSINMDEPSDNVPVDRGPHTADTEYMSDVESTSSLASDDGQTIDSIVDSFRLYALAKSFAHVLYWDPELHSLYAEAIAMIGEVRFSLNMSRLLKVLIKTIRDLKTDPAERLALELMAQRRFRTEVTSCVIDKVQAEFPGEVFTLMEKLSINNFDDDYRQLLLTLGKQITEESRISAANPKDTRSASLTLTSMRRGGLASTASPSIYHSFSYELSFIDSPLQVFKSSLAALIDPTQAISAALDAFDQSALVTLFERNFCNAPQGEYFWLQELKEFGYTPEDIAKLLIDDAANSPWIYFTPSDEDSALDVQLDHHLTDCVHTLSWSDQPSSESAISATQKSSELASSPAVLAAIQRLCGLAGVIPSSRNRQNWHGSVTFEEENSVAVVSYWHTDNARIASSITCVLELFCKALTAAQSDGRCCESFTILKDTQCASDGLTSGDQVVELCRVKFATAVAILDEMKSGDAESGHSSPVSPSAVELLTQLWPDIDMENISGDSNDDSSLHICAMATQVMSFGFQSYLQAHVGAFHPLFLDTPLRRIRLCGCAVSPEQSTEVEFELRELTCMSDMLQGPVLSCKLLVPFSGAFASPVPSPHIPSYPLPIHLPHLLESVKWMGYDLLSSPEDLIDTWGPGQLMMSNLPDALPRAIRIGGGIIAAIDSRGHVLHWSRETALILPGQSDFELRVKVRIGWSVTVNEACELDEKECRARYFDFLHPLGPYPPGWKLEALQAGVQAGVNVIVQANAGYHRYPGRTLKQFRLDQGDETLLSFLEDHWAVQVSLCTGISRRVSLREMVADLMPIFADGITLGEDFCIWKKLRDEHVIVDIFQDLQRNLKSCLRTLDKPLHEFIVRIVRLILQSLRDTGLDHRGHSLLVSWPYVDDIFQCFKIDLSCDEASWARLIADSEDCATFAYVTPKCLETEHVRCGGVNSSWPRVIPLLETAVMVCPSQQQLRQPSSVPNALRHNETYYFRKLDGLEFVKVEKPDGTKIARIVQKTSNIPDRFKQRLFAKSQRLRERRGVNEVGEKVALLTSAISWVAMSS